MRFVIPFSYQGVHFHIVEPTALGFSFFSHHGVNCFRFLPYRGYGHVILLHSAVFSFIAWSLGNPSALCAREIGSLAVSDVLHM